MIVSDVGRTMSGSSSSPGGDELAVGALLEPVVRDDRALLGEALDVLGFLLEEASGMNSGKYAFWWPVALNMPSSTRWMFSQIA